MSWSTRSFCYDNIAVSLDDGDAIRSGLCSRVERNSSWSIVVVARTADHQAFAPRGYPMGFVQKNIQKTFTWTLEDQVTSILKSAALEMSQSVAPSMVVVSSEGSIANDDTPNSASEKIRRPVNAAAGPYVVSYRWTNEQVSGLDCIRFTPAEPNVVLRAGESIFRFEICVFIYFLFFLL